MTTVSDILSLALKDAGVIGEGETASAETTQDALSTLNQMLGLWQVDSLSVYAQQETSFSATGVASYTIGSGATIDATRPVSIESAFYRSNGQDYPITVLTDFSEFQQIGDKTESGEPEYLFYRPAVANGVIYLWPQPSSGTVHLTTLVDMPEYTSTANALSLPRSYELPVRFNLAVMLAAVHQLPLRPDIAAMAANTKRMIKRQNVRIAQLGMPSALVRGAFDIERGD